MVLGEKNLNTTENIIKPGIPLGVVRSALFGVAERDHSLVSNLELEASTNYPVTIRYSGPRLNQMHALVWQTILHFASSQKIDAGSDELSVYSPELLRALGWTDVGTRARDWLWKHLRDLTHAHVELKTPRHSYAGSLLLEVYKVEKTGKLTLRFNHRLAALLKDEVVHIDLARKTTIGRNQLALWLHDYLSSQNKCFPVRVDEVRRLCGSPLALRQFRPRLKLAMELLTQGTNPVLKTWSIDKQDRLTYEAKPSRVTMLPAKAQTAMQGLSKYQAAVDQALRQRAAVPL